MTPTFAQLVEDAGGAQALAKRLKVGKDWVYRRLSGKTPIKKKDELLIAQVMTAKPKKWKSALDR
jgi:hypothetical protein